MPNGVHTGTARPPGEPQPAAINTQVGDREQRRELHSWWRQFRHRGARKEDEKVEQHEAPTEIFGVALQESIRYANVAISLYDVEGNSYIYGYVPIVVAKCGVFLKEKATEIEGIFRLSGSEKRIKELRANFNSPPRWGKGLNWDGYTVHDAANILRRYFNQLPEPIVPLEFYERFRAPLKGHQEQAVGAIDGQQPSTGTFNLEVAITTYQGLITELPPLNRQLLLYILDLLAVFASKSDLNKMTTPNLAAIFQPGLISHPNHDMAPSEYRLSQDVLIFLIENQDHFLIGMQGTEADPKTVQEVESGPPTPQAHTPTTAGRSKTLLARSGSTSSAGAESVRKYGGVRRNVSTSSRHSRNSSGVSPVTPSFQTQSTPGGGTGSGGVYRSNTLPSKRSPNIPGARFGREQAPGQAPSSGGTTPPIMERQPIPAEPAVISPSDSEGATPIAEPPDVAVTSAKATEPNNIDTSVSSTQPEGTQRDVPTPLETPTGESSVSKTLGNLGGLFVRTPTGEPKDPMRKPNKLQKKRMPSSSNPSAHSSTNSLPAAGSVQDGPPSPLPQGPLQPIPQSVPQRDLTLQPAPAVEGTPQKNTATGAALKPSVSPSTSFRTHSTVDRDVDPSASEAEGERVDEKALALQGDSQPEKKEKRRWKLHSSKDTPSKKDRNERADATATPTPAGRENTMSTIGSSTIGSSAAAHQSHSSVNSLGDSSAPRKSMQGVSDSDYVEGDEKEKKGGPLGWLRKKHQERQEKKEEKARAKSPPVGPVRGDMQPGSMLSLNSSPPREGAPVGRGRSFDAQRELAQKMEDPTSRPAEVTLQAIGPGRRESAA